MSVKVTINGKEESVDEGTTVRQLVAREGFEETLQVVVDHNGELLDDENLDRTVSPGDSLRILPMVAGG